MSQLLTSLHAEAAAQISPAAVAEWPCENYNSNHWRRLARCGDFGVFARIEPDTDCSADYEVPPPAGTEWVGVVLQLRTYGEVLNHQSLWAIESPGFRPVGEPAWQAFYWHLADCAACLLGELLNPPTIAAQVNHHLHTWQSAAQQLAEVPVANG